MKLSKKRLNQLQAEMYVEGFKDGAAFREKKTHEHLHEDIVKAYESGYSRGLWVLDGAIVFAKNAWNHDPGRQ